MARKPTEKVEAGIPGDWSVLVKVAAEGAGSTGLMLEHEGLGYTGELAVIARSNHSPKAAEMHLMEAVESTGPGQTALTVSECRVCIGR
jgi:hypothetical protein